MTQIVKPQIGQTSPVPCSAKGAAKRLRGGESPPEDIPANVSRQCLQQFDRLLGERDWL